MVSKVDNNSDASIDVVRASVAGIARVVEGRALYLPALIVLLKNRRLKDDVPGVRTISVQPDSAIHGLEGMKHLETALVPGIYDAKVADENLDIPTEKAYYWVKRLAREEGILAGISCGAVLEACFRIAARIEKEPIEVEVKP